MNNEASYKGRGKPQDLGSKGKSFKPKHKHLGGKGLSLPAFANAKSKPAFNPAELRKQREYYKNAKNVKKYRKLVKRLENEEHNNQLQIDMTTSEVLALTEGTKQSKIKSVWSIDQSQR